MAELVERRVELAARWPLTLPRGGADGVTRVRGGVLERLLHVEDRPVLVRAFVRGVARVALLGAWGPSRGACEVALARMRFALALDEDLAPFHRRHRDDPLIGASLRRRPWLRAPRRAEPFEALAWAICEQLIEYARAAAIERRIVRRLGRGSPGSALRDLPSPHALAAAAPALLASLDLSAGRALALRRAAREVARGRIDLHDPDHERGWRALRAIPGIGSWTVDCLALHGQGRLEVVPAGDLGLRKLVGRLRAGDPYARASEEEVRAFFVPYAPWAGLAAAHAIGGAAALIRPGPPGTRW